MEMVACTLLTLIAGLCFYSSFQMFSPPVSGGKNRPTTLGSSQFSASGRTWSLEPNSAKPQIMDARYWIRCPYPICWYFTAHLADNRCWYMYTFFLPPNCSNHQVSSIVELTYSIIMHTLTVLACRLMQAWNPKLKIMLRSFFVQKKKNTWTCILWNMSYLFMTIAIKQNKWDTS